MRVQIGREPQGPKGLPFMKTKKQLDDLIGLLNLPEGLSFALDEDGTKLKEINPDDNTSYIVTISGEKDDRIYREGFVVHPWSNYGVIEGKFRVSLIEFRRRGMIQ